MKKKLTSVLLFLALSAGVVSAQTSKVTGKVIGEDGEPVIGASIIVKGTTVGTVTDFDGNFELEVPANGKQLVISYIGMKSQEVAATSNVNVKLLADTQNLDEVVVTAMGISKEKKALGYAVQDVKADELTKGANTSLSGALQGKVSGVEISPSSGMPGASSKITIRGSRSFTGDNTPLYVIDGMPVASTADVDTGSSVSGTDFASRAVDIDPNDIESINILKGQAASALYGMRATNGVIVITTKSGKGARKGKPQVAFNTSLSFDKVYTSPLTRCVRLATFCGYPDAERDDRLKELNFGDWEMHRFDEIADANLERWYADYLHVKATNGESFEDQYRRVAGFLDELRQKPYEQVAIFAHGGILLNAQIYAGIIKPEEAFGALTPYGGIVKIELS